MKRAGRFKVGTDNSFAVLQPDVALVGADGLLAPISQPAPAVPAAEEGCQASQPLPCSPPRLSSANEFLQLLELPITVGD